MTPFEKVYMALDLETEDAVRVKGPYEWCVEKCLRKRDDEDDASSKGDD